MKVLVIGAAGKSGQLIVERAIAAGHQVTAFVHHPEKYDAPPSVRVVAGDATDGASLDEAIAGQDAVIDTVGGKTPYLNTDMEQRVAEAALAAMKRHGVRRFIAISALGAGDSVQQATFFYEHLLMPTFLRGAMKDKAAMEQAVRESGLEFILLRPSMLTDDPATGSVRVVEGETKAHKITRADVAQFAVDQLQSSQYVGQSITITNQ